MATDSLAWLAGEIGLPTVEESAGSADGGARLVAWNEAARAALGDGGGRGFVGAVSRLLAGVDEREVEHARERARRGIGGSISAPAGRVLFEPWLGGVRAVVLSDDAAAMQLAAHIHHEVANALTAVQGWARVAREASERPGEEARVREALRHTEAAAALAAAQARALLDGGRDFGERPPSTCAGDVLAEVGDLVAPLASSRGVTLEVHASSVTVAATHAELVAMAWNLTKNAVEAAPRGSSVELRADEDHAEPGYAALVVSDEGSGVPDAFLEGSYRPRFSTKEGGSGVGIGVVDALAARRGGRLRFVRRTPRGTHSIVSLPRAAAPTPPVTASVAGRRVLVVDDDVHLRAWLETTLMLRDASVTAVANPAEVGEVAPFDLALIDLALSAERGDHALASLRARAVVDRAILMTGGTPPDDPVPGGEPDATLRKPFGIAEIERAFADVLARR